jgi:hypothetical protein
MLINIDDIKTILDIPLSDTSQDAKIGLLYDKTLGYIESYIGYPLENDDYTDYID